jgi:predicted dehydrogenase
MGLGSIGQRHARLLAGRPDVQLSLCDPVEQARQQARAALGEGVPVHSDVASALAGRPQAVVVAAPNDQHVPLALAAVGAGAHVLVEKPLADVIDAAAQLVDEARRARRVLHVGYVLRYDMGLRWIRDMIQQGRIGTVVAARAQVGSYQTLLSSRGGERLNSPFSLIGDYSHELDYLGWLLGPIARVHAQAATLGALERRPQPNVAQMSLTFAGGALAQVHMDYVQHPIRRTLDIIGDQGTLDYDFMSGRLRHFPFGPQHTWHERTIEPMAQRFDGLFAAEHEAFLQACRRDDGKADIDGHEGLAVMRVTQALIESIQTGAVLRL